MESPVTKSAPSLSNLSDELLLNVIDHLFHDHRRYPRSRPLIQLSRTNRHFRNLIRPLLIQSIDFAKMWDVFCPDDAWDHMSATIKRLPSHFPLSKITKVKMEFPDLSYYLQPIVAKGTAEFLVSLTNLAYLDIHFSPIWHDFRDSMDDCHDANPLAFRSVTTLSINFACMFLLAYFTETQRISISDPMSLNFVRRPPTTRYVGAYTFVEFSGHNITDDGRRYPTFTDLKSIDDVRRVFGDVIGSYSVGYMAGTKLTRKTWVLAESGEDGFEVHGPGSSLF